MEKDKSKARFNNQKRSRGFTLIEMLLSVAIISVLAGMSVPVYQSFQVRNDLDIVANSYVESLRRGIVLAQTGEGDSSWGVNVANGNVVLFKGLSYLLRDPIFDEVFEIPASITSSGISEVVFTKFTGLPNVNGTMILTSNTNEVRNISINEKGMVDF